jgi:asparagine N-glycosylation enzyme membrane subunit Stt3
MNESEWRDATPPTIDLANKGRVAIICIAGGILLGIIGFLGMRIRPLGLAAGTFAFVSGLVLLMRRKRGNVNIKAAIVITVAGFLMLLANPRFGLVAGFASYFLITGAIGLVILGLFKAIKLSWDLGKRS